MLTDGMKMSIECDSRWFNEGQFIFGHRYFAGFVFGFYPIVISLTTRPNEIRRLKTALLKPQNKFQLGGEDG